MKTTIAPFDQLTPRECAVAYGLACGKFSRELAAEMNISTKTIDTYRAAVLKKAAVRNNVELARLAIRTKWVEP